MDAKPPHHILTVEQLRERCPDYFLKPIWGNRGRGIKRVNNGEVPSSKGRGNASVIVRTVPQPEYSYTISPVSWNTVRAVVMRMPKTREIFLPIAVHRFGTLRTAPVDNWSQDELSCEIDIQSGRMGVGIGHPSEFDGALVKHSINPDTGNPLDGVVIPHWNDAVSLVKALMDVFPEIDVAGWDLLPVDGGWCVIEGNDQMDIDLLKVHRGLLAYERVREFIAHHFPKYWRVKLHS